MITYQNLSGFTEIWYQGRQVQEVYSNTSKVWPTDTKFSATYIGGQTYTKYCNGDTELSLSETQPSGYEYSAMTEAIIGNCVSSIGGGAFANCSSLTSVIIPSGVTSIGGAAFGGCNSLISITIPSGVTSIGAGTFQNCHSLTGVTIPSGVTTIGFAAFEYCTALTSITIPNSVTTIGVGAFQNCSGLSSITVNATTPPTLDSGVFYNTNNCPIYVPCQSVDAYKTAWSAYASRIQCVEPPFDGKWKATYSGGQTYSAACDGNTELTTATTKPSGYEYSAMTTAEIGDCVTSIGGSAFYQCTSLTSITIPNSVTSIGNVAFYQCSLTSVDIPNSVTSIGDTAFCRCSSLTSLTIGSGVTSIGVQAFYQCTSLTSVNIPNSVTTIDYMTFGGCRSLTSIDIPSGVTSIGGDAFYQCTSLTSITINATTPPILGSRAFDNTNNCPIYVPCESLESYKTAEGWVNYADRIQCFSPSFDGKFKATYSSGETYEKECDGNPTLTTGDTHYKWYDYNSMTSAEIGDCVTTIGENAFNYFSSLTSVTLGNSVTSIGFQAFISCDRLSSINFSDSLISIGNDSFAYCDSLTSITIPNSVTSIGSNAFYVCSGLTSVDIPSGVTSIGERAFQHCTSLTAITCNAITPPTLGGSVFDNTNCIIYVPAASVDTYKSATNWSTYADRIQPIS